MFVWRSKKLVQLTFLYFDMPSFGFESQAMSNLSMSTMILQWASVAHFTVDRPCSDGAIKNLINPEAR